MKTTLLLLLAALLPAQAGKKREKDTRLVVTLTDGSSFRSEVTGEPLVVRTEFGEQTIPVHQLRALKRVNDLEFQVRTDTVSVAGELGSKELQFKTEIGTVQVPLGEIKMITSGGGPALLVDHATVALWDLGEAQSGVSHDLVRNRPLQLGDFEIGGGGDREPRSAARKSDDTFGEAASDEALDAVASEDFTLEVRFKSAASPRGYTALLSKNERTSGSSSDFLVFLQGNGLVHFQATSNRGTVSFNTPSPVVRMNEWTYLAVVVQPQRQTVTIFVNGRQVHQQPTPFYTTGMQGNPLFIGTSPPYRGSFGCADRIQFVRISKTARTAEEMLELQSMFDSEIRIGGAGLQRGVVFRDGGFIRAEFPKLAGAVFRTAYGPLTLAENTAGQLTVYRIREPELERLRKELKSLVPQLGSTGVVERDEAEAKIVEAAEAAVPFLKEARKSTDPEVKSRAEALLKKFDEKGVTGRPIGDSLRMGQTVLHGWIDASTVEVVTRFGTVPVALERIGRLNLGDRHVQPRPVMKLRTGELIQADAPKGTTLELETGFGALAVPFRDVTALSYDSAKETWTVRTERLTASGKVGRGEMKVITPAGTVQVPLSAIEEILPPGKH